MARSHRRFRGDEGVAVVEFALVLPVIVMLLLGMITAGVAWNEHLALGSAARVSGRYGATLPMSTYSTVDLWLDALAEKAIDAGEGELDDGQAGRMVCVAYVHPAATTPSTATRSRTENAAGAVSYANTSCYTDGLGSNDQRVQVVLEKTGTLNAGIWGKTITLRRQVVYRFEADGGL